MAWDPMRLVIEAENVWDTPAQAMTMVILAKHFIKKRGYAVVSHKKVAAVIGVDPRYAQRIFEQLEFKKHAVQPFDQADTKGQRNRYVLTLERAFKKVRIEAGAPDDAPLWRLPSRATKRKRRRGTTPDGHDPGIVGVDVDSAVAAENLDPGIVGTHDPGIVGGRSWDRGGTILGSWPSGEDLKSTKNKKEATSAADASGAAPRLPGFGLAANPDAVPPVSSRAHAAREASTSALYHRVADKARRLLRDPVLAATHNGGAPLTTESDLVEATKNYCGALRIPYADAVHRACASEWLKAHNLALMQGLVERPRDLAKRRRRQRES